MRSLFIITTLSVFTLGVTHSSNAQSSLDLHGRVVNSETGEGVPFVNIGIENLGMGTVSNSEGNYILNYNQYNTSYF